MSEHGIFVFSLPVPNMPRVMCAQWGSVKGYNRLLTHIVRMFHKQKYTTRNEFRHGAANHKRQTAD